MTNELLRTLTPTDKCDKFIKSITESEIQSSLLFLVQTACFFEIYVYNRCLAINIAIAINI